MPVTNDETLFSRNSHGNPKDIGSKFGYLAANADFLVVVLEEASTIAHEFEARKSVPHSPRGARIREFSRAKHEHGRASGLGLARHVIEQV